MTLSFGSMIVEVNIFHTSSQPLVIDDHKEVSMIDILISHIFEGSYYDDPLEKYLTHFGQNVDIDELIEEVNALLDFVPIMYTNPWKFKTELLPVSTFVHIPSII